jgi:hypothetical protein
MYLDCIDDQGNCFIVYWAKTEFFLVRFFYSGLIFSDMEGLTVEKSAIRNTRKPAVNEVVQFKNKDLEIEVFLKRTGNAIIRSLFKDDKKNELVWDCHHPSSSAEILYHGSIYKGFGYSETLISYIKPWNLPIEELRWGRFLSDSYTVIWLNCLGKNTINKIFINGIEFNDAVFENGDVVFNDSTYQLRFADVKVIRKGKLSGLFIKMRFFKMLLNHRILNTTEIKYKARTTFSKNSVLLSNGWSLFELVTWGN